MEDKCLRKSTEKIYTNDSITTTVFGIVLDLTLAIGLSYMYIELQTVQLSTAFIT